jgi:hypothetical protein
MGLGLLLLVSVGKENIYLSTQPEITYFKIAYKRYTNFSTETVAQYFMNSPDFGRHVTVNISKNADLLNKIYIYVNLPDIIRSNSKLLPPDIKTFAWVKKIGLAIIKYVDLEIGGILVERNFNDWLNIWYELTTTQGKKDAYNKMIGNIDILTNYTNGKKSYGLNIPLNFWFCQDSGLALPLVAMIHNDIKLQIEFNDFNSVFNESPTNYITVVEPFCLFKKGELIKQNVNGILAIGEFIYFDIVNQFIYYNKLDGNFLVPINLNDQNYAIIGSITLFVTNIVPSSLVVIDEPYFRFNTPSILEAYLLVNYIYLDNEERFAFLNKSHEYLIPIVSNISKVTHSYTNSSFKIPFTNPNKIIFWMAQLNSNININDIFNYTLYPISEKHENIIEQNTILINSIPRMEPNSVEFYTNLQIYLNNFVSSSPGINMFSFSLNPNDYQPSGSLNFSQIDDAYIQIKVNKNISYNKSITTGCYGLQNNIFKVSNGLGGLGYFI